MKPTLRLFLIAGLFILAIIGSRLLWNKLHTPIKLQAVNGILDLRGFELPAEYTADLDGQWEFLPYRLSWPDPDGAASSSYLQVPGSWNPAFPENDSAYRFGTYRLRIVLNENDRQPYAIRLTNVWYASAIYVNGQRLAGSGQPADNRDETVPRNVPYSVSFTPDGNVIDVAIPVSGHPRLTDGGIPGSILFGPNAALTSRTYLSIGMQLLLVVLFLMHGFYVIIVYWIELMPRSKALSAFFTLIVCMVVGILIDDDRLLLTWLPAFAFDLRFTLACLVYTGSVASLVRLVMHLFPEPGWTKWYGAYFALCGVFVLYVLLLPPQYFLTTKILFTLVMMIPAFALPLVLIRMYFKGKEDVIFLILSALSIWANIVWAVVKNNVWNVYFFYPFDLLIAFLCFAAYWFKRFFRANRKAAQLTDKLIKADKAKDEFLAGTSHELRNPLHGMINIAQSMLDEEHSAKNRQKLQLLIDVGRRMSLLLGDLLDVTRLRENSVRLQRGSVSVHAVASGVVDMLRIMSDGKPVRFEIQIPGSLPPVWADENRLIQIMFNLLHNAVKFTNEGTIAVRARERDREVFIEVADTGIGMEEALQNRIFQPYEQGDTGNAAYGGGLGLGLSICKQLVELHGGVLEVRSAPGQGSVFCFTLPLADSGQPMPDQAVIRPQPPIGSETSLASAQPAAAREPRERGEASAKGSVRILIVDDDPVNLGVLESILSADRYLLTRATSGIEAIAQIERQTFDLVISDIMMPHMSGYEFTRCVREKFSISELPILLLTARSRPEDIDMGFLAGANDYVTKPVDALELRARVRALTELRQSVDERLRMEAAWLQAQIQPHFLFNTLNSISSLGDIDTGRMQGLLEEFAKYLRLSFDFHHAQRVVPLERELRLVRSYLHIEQERFGKRLHVIWELDPSLTLELPSFSIQPLVENAVRHGVLRRPQGGTIRIRTSDRGDYGEVAVIDDGIGMDEDKLRSLLGGASVPGRGIGLRNTDRRLRQLYGKGLNIQSALGEGTVITFQIPKA